MTNFLLLKPDFFFGVSGPAQKAVLVPFFRGGIYDLFIFISPNFFLGLRRISVISVGVFVFGAQNSKNLRAISYNTENGVPFSAKWAAPQFGLFPAPSGSPFY
jgi:hypothetical protein